MMIITNEEQLKDPVIVYTVMNQWMCEVGEDLIDYNEDYIDGDKILEWILKKGYITKEKYDQVIKNKETWIQDLLFGYEEGLLNDGHDFPSIDKAYQVIAEYISEDETLREEFIYLFCTSFDEDKGDESRSGMSGSYDAEDGYPICAHIDDFDLQEGTMSKEDWLKESYAAKISYTDEYNYLKDMTFEVCNNLKED